MRFQQKVKNDWKNGASFKNLRNGRTVASARNHQGDSALVIALICVVMKQLMELRGGREHNDNQQVSGEQAGECVLPRFGVSKPLHLHPFKALYRPWQKIVMRTTLRSSMRGVEEEVATATTWSDFSEMIFA
jgi:hypothetical protein